MPTHSACKEFNTLSPPASVWALMQLRDRLGMCICTTSMPTGQHHSLFSFSSFSFEHSGLKAFSLSRCANHQVSQALNSNLLSSRLVCLSIQSASDVLTLPLVIVSCRIQWLNSPENTHSQQSTYPQQAGLLLATTQSSSAPLPRCVWLLQFINCE